MRSTLAKASVAGLVVAVAAFLVVSASGSNHSPRVPQGRATAHANPDIDPGSSAKNLPAPGFTLRDQRGRKTTLAQFRGKVVLLAFVDPYCTTICPLTTQSMVEALKLLGPAASGVQLLGIDANPLAVRVADVAAYTKAHGLQGRWRFLTGSLAQLRRVWHDYHVYLAANGNNIDHEPIVFLIDRQGREHTVYLTQMSYEGVSQQADVLARAITGLLPNHGALGPALSLGYVQPLEPDSRVRLEALGPRHRSVRLGPDRPHLLVFFATWLPKPKELAAHLAALDSYAALARRHGWPAPVSVDELTTEASRAVAVKKLTRLASNLKTPILGDTDGRLGDGYQVQDLPQMMLTGKSGSILWHHHGWLSAQAIAKRVSSALSGAPSTVAGGSARSEAGR